jgi:hypothetical protein
VHHVVFTVPMHAGSFYRLGKLTGEVVPGSAEMFSATINCCDSVVSPVYIIAHAYYGAFVLIPSQTGRDSSVGIVTRYGLDGPWIESRWGAIFSVPVQTGPEVNPAPYSMETGSFPEVKQPGYGIDHPSHLAPRLRKE